MPKMSPQQAQALMQQINRDAAAAGMTPREFVRQLIQGGAHIVGAQTHLTDDGVSANIVDELEDAPSDFDALVRRRNRLLQETGGDELAMEALMQQHERSQLSQGSPAPASATKGVLGSSALVAASLSDAAPQVYGGISIAPARGVTKDVQTVQVASWNADNDFETRPVTIMFQNIVTALGATTGGLRPFGLVQVGTRDSSAPIYVDIARGCMFTIAASNVAVFVGLDPVAASNANRNQMQLAGMISFMPVVRTTPIYRTVYLDYLAGTTLSVNVPPFANRVWLVRDNIATVAVSLDFRDSNLVEIYQHTLAAGAQMTTPIPLSSDVAVIDVTKTAGNSSEARLIFELGL